MANATSRFFAQFSLRELVGLSSPLPPGYPRQRSGGIGGGSGYGGLGSRNYQKSESCSRPISRLSNEIFNEAEFITVLRREIQSQITDSGSTVTFQGEIEGNFHSNEFYFEYLEGEIQGRIMISGGVIGEAYWLSAKLEEKAYTESALSPDGKSSSGNGT